MEFILSVKPNDKGVEFINVTVSYLYNNTTNDITGEPMPRGYYLEIMPAIATSSEIFPIQAAPNTERIIRLLMKTDNVCPKAELIATKKALILLVSLVNRVCKINGLVLAEDEIK